ncbi:MAG TPA: sensor domain-containing diguanylate cyclase [Geminicoccus sp.]|jgi:diguanylate cyclase (GGDEF)-like protein|uniref:sensor domain-containing diguanylate cyclase n=1 Tax=Geminicoccus sp. TaxID=2024832 RepID=UPI002E33BAC2|nr:sensor domain-containing diguanylate cyclase [Geminicoccus sp.]HEX2525215.1 sensor domain-containing diguanylate cyclase [Geminicoccus sp.]
MVHEGDQAAVDEVMDALIEGRESQYAIEHRIRNGHGEVVWVHNRASALERDASGRAVRLVGLLGDVTDRRRTMLQFEYLAHHDTLTGLLNRTAFWDAVRGALLTEQPAALVLVDLDEFKPVNDDHGHDIGDRLLMEVAARLHGVLRRSDTIARLGGDEFAILCPNFQGGRDERIVTRILATLAEPFAIEDRIITISGSAGVAIASGTDQPDQLYARADAALYSAKRAGRNCYAIADP